MKTSGGNVCIKSWAGVKSRYLYKRGQKEIFSLAVLMLPVKVKHDARSG